MITDGSINEVSAPRARTMGALVREVASRWPDNPAVVFDRKRLSFSEFDALVDKWARGLVALGIGRGDCVAVLIGNRPEWLVATMAAARIGALVAPINTWYQADELVYALEHSRAVVLITAAGQAGQDFTALVSQVCPRFGEGASAHADASADDDAAPALRTVVGIDDARPARSTSLAEFLSGGEGVTDAELAAAEQRVGGGDDLFLLYTSGSTARPKGVLLQHRSTIINDFNIGTRMGLDPGDRAWIAIPLFYGFAAVNAIVAVWSHGGALVLQERFDADVALDIIERERATVYYGLGNMTRSLLTANETRRRDITSLQKGLTGYSHEDKRLAIEDLGVDGCCSIYGLTESHGLTAMTDWRDPVEVRLSSDGRALPGWELRVVDPATGDPVADGTVGHLLIKGHLTSGYLGDAELTAAAFTDDGFFRTGDLVSVAADGAITFHSRLKELIKTGGINVSPLEVEALLEEHPAVSQALVIGIPDDQRGEVAVAVVQVREGATVSQDELRAYVKGRAASFKVPARIVFRTQESLPKLASGKVARRVLRDQVIGGHDGSL